MGARAKPTTSVQTLKLWRRTRVGHADYGSRLQKALNANYPRHELHTAVALSAKYEARPAACVNYCAFSSFNSRLWLPVITGDVHVCRLHVPAYHHGVSVLVVKRWWTMPG